MLGRDGECIMYVVMSRAASPRYLLEQGIGNTETILRNVAMLNNA